MTFTVNRYRCSSCSGEYDSHTVDQGLIYQYYHSCPPSIPKRDRRDERVVLEKDGSRPRMKVEPVMRKGVPHWIQATHIVSEGTGRIEIGAREGDV